MRQMSFSVQVSISSVIFVVERGDTALNLFLHVFFIIRAKITHLSSVSERSLCQQPSSVFAARLYKPDKIIRSHSCLSFTGHICVESPIILFTFFP